MAVALGELDQELDATGEGVRVLDLHGWVRHLISLASTDAVYGAENPFRRDRRVEDGFWYVVFSSRGYSASIEFGV